MARPRIPLEKAILTGRVAHDPKRFAGRKEPPSAGPLGDPPTWMKKQEQIEAWRALGRDLPWLNKSNRAITGIAADLLGRQMSGEDIGIKAFSLLRMCLSSMGATPSDASKVAMPEPKGDVDPADKYF